MYSKLISSLNIALIRINCYRNCLAYNPTAIFSSCVLSKNLFETGCIKIPKIFTQYLKSGNSYRLCILYNHLKPFPFGSIKDKLHIFNRSNSTDFMICLMGFWASWIHRPVEYVHLRTLSRDINKCFWRTSNQKIWINTVT